jgi:predicted esterase
MPEPVVLTIETPTHGRVLVRACASPPPRGLLVGFHGYGENAERHLTELEKIPGSAAWTLVAVQGLHRFYRFKSDEVIASWMTRQDRELAIADNLAYVDHVVGACGAAPRLVFVGFSQGTATAFRSAALGRSVPVAVIALGGDIPPELKTSEHRALPPALIGRGTGDTWYTAEKLAADLDYLRAAGVDARSFVFDGGHEWTDAFREEAGRFLDSLA